MGLEHLFCTTAETLLAFTFDACRETEKKAVTVGAGSDTESVILGNMFRELIESNTDIEVKTLFGLDGISGCFDALKEGHIDMFVGDMGAALSLGKLEGRISDAAMAEMIRQVNVIGIGAPEAAWRFLKDNKFLNGQ